AGSTPALKGKRDQKRNRVRPIPQVMNGIGEERGRAGEIDNHDLDDRRQGQADQRPLGGPEAALMRLHDIIDFFVNVVRVQERVLQPADHAATTMVMVMIVSMTMPVTVAMSVTVTVVVTM